jgi:hypothetical protein
MVVYRPTGFKSSAVFFGLLAVIIISIVPDRIHSLLARTSTDRTVDFSYEFLVEASIAFPK